MSDMFPIRNGFIVSAFEYAIRRVRVNQDGLKLNGTHQLWFLLMMLIYWEEVYILQSKMQKL